MLIYPTLKYAPLPSLTGLSGGPAGLGLAGSGGAGTEYEFWLWGAGGGAGSQNRTGSSYHTTSYTKIKEGGAGGVVYVRMSFTSGTSLLLTVGGKGRGGGQDGNGTNSVGGYNGGGRGSVSNNDGSGSGGGYTGIFLGSGDSDKTQAKSVVISPGGGGAGSGPGYYNSGFSNGGGGITDSNTDGRGQQGTRGGTAVTRLAGGGFLTSGGIRGKGTSPGGEYNNVICDGAALQGGQGISGNWGNSWGSGGGGGGGWFGGGVGGHDGNNWDGGGGGAGSAFVRGSGLTYNADGNASLSGVIYVSHTFHKQTFGYDGNGTNNTTGTGYYNMNMPTQTGNALYPGGNCAYGGLFDTSPADNISNNGNDGAIVYRLYNTGSWTTLSTSGNTVLTTV